MQTRHIRDILLYSCTSSHFLRWSETPDAEERPRLQFTVPVLSTWLHVLKNTIGSLYRWEVSEGAERH